MFSCVYGENGFCGEPACVCVPHVEAEGWCQASSSTTHLILRQSLQLNLEFGISVFLTARSLGSSCRYSRYCVCWLVLSIWHKLDSPGEREALLRSRLHQTDMSLRVFSWLVIDVVPSPLWTVAFRLSLLSSAVMERSDQEQHGKIILSGVYFHHRLTQREFRGRTETEAMEEGFLLTCFLSHSVGFFSNPGQPTQVQHHPRWDVCSHINHWSRKWQCLEDLTTGQSGEGNFFHWSLLSPDVSSLCQDDKSKPTPRFRDACAQHVDEYRVSELRSSNLYTEYFIQSASLPGLNLNIF